VKKKTIFVFVSKKYKSRLYKICFTGSEEIEEPRPNYWGTMRVSPITGQQEQYYSPLKRKVKTYAISYPVVLLCMKVATVVMLIYFKLQFYMEDKYGKSGGIIGSIMLLVPSIFYAVMIAVLNHVYHYFGYVPYRMG
jgi:anoctamin-10